MCLVDDRLGGRDGTGFLGAIESGSCSIPMVLITDPEDGPTDDAARPGFTDRLARSQVTPRLLERTILHAVERHRALHALGVSEARYRTLAENVDDAVSLHDADGVLLYASPAVARITGLPPEQAVGKPWLELVHPDDRDRVAAAALESALAGEPTVSVEWRALREDGTSGWVESRSTSVRGSGGRVERLLVVTRDVSERQRADADLREANERAIVEYRLLLDRLDTLAQGVGAAGDLARVFRALLRFVVASAPSSGLLVSLYDPGRRERTCAYSGGSHGEDDVSGLPSLPLNGSPQSRAVETGEAVVTRDLQATLASAGVRQTLLGEDADPDPPRSSVAVPILVQGRTVGVFEAQSTLLDAFTADHVTVLKAAASVAAIAVENARLLRQERRAREDVQASERRFRSLVQNSSDVIAVVDARGTVVYQTPSAVLVFGRSSKRATGRPFVGTIHPDDRPAVLAAFGSLAEGRSVSARLEARYIRESGGWGWVEAVASNLLDDPSVRGIVVNAREISERKQAEARIAHLNATLQQRLWRTAALREVDAALAASTDLRLTLGVLMGHATRELGMDAAAVSVLDPHTQEVRLVSSLGFADDALQWPRSPLGQGLADRAALERRTIEVRDLADSTLGDLRQRHLEAEGFRYGVAAPLIAKGEVKGVLALFSRELLEPDEEWREFLLSVAGQAAIAMDAAGMLEGLRRSNAELALAYDATIEGWARALDLRDKETEGHSRRVTEMAVRLARAVGVPDDQVVHVRRGALLHDVGKLGVPDAILLKPGKLTDDEWTLMRRHPDLAVGMLRPIEFLRPALAIPQFHHERWDGAGYPRGLAGEAIPLAARVFAVVDVWDALGSDRPYRAAWPTARIAAYLREGAGSHFDPAVVRPFLALLEGEP